MTKKKVLRVILVLILLSLLLAAGAYYFFMPRKAAGLPDFSPMPMDTAGNNLIGNLPENLEAGGFMAGQNGWIYFANFADGGALYMCRENGGDMTKITDFPVCNINVLGTSLVFSGFEYHAFEDGGYLYDEAGYDEAAPLAFTDLFDFISSYTGMPYFLGGKLYAIYGIGSTDKPDFCVIDPDITYYSPYLDRDGLYAAYSEFTHNVLVNKFNAAKIVFPQKTGFLQKRFSSGDKIYAELWGLIDEKGRIMRIVRVDAKTLMPLDYINGWNLNRIGKSLVFHGEDGFIYEITPASGEIKPISYVPVNNFSMNQFSEIEAYLNSDVDSEPVLISKEQMYKGIAQIFMSWRESKPIILQNGWYNYFNEYQRHYNNGKHFKANDKYYSLNSSGWSEAWLNVKLDSGPLVSLDALAVEDAFTPPWIDYSEGAEPVDSASAEDFGSERPASGQPDSRADAADDAVAALDAAIFLLIGDESIAEKYAGESVEKLRNHYGGVFESEVTDAAVELADTVSTKLGISASSEEMRDIIVIWLENAAYSVGGANIASNGEEAAITLSVENALDLDALYTEYHNEFSVRTVEEPELLQMSANEKAAWAADLLAEIMREPAQYHIVKGQAAALKIDMTYSGCWIADNPGALIRGLIYGI